MTQNENIKDWVRKKLMQQTRKPNSKELDKIIKDTKNDLVNSMMKIFKPEYLRSDSQRTLLQLEKLPARLPIDTEEFDDGSLRIFELHQLHQYQH